jgi:hypothetical protein
LNDILGCIYRVKLSARRILYTRSSILCILHRCKVYMYTVSAGTYGNSQGKNCQGRDCQRKDYPPLKCFIVFPHKLVYGASCARIMYIGPSYWHSLSFMKVTRNSTIIQPQSTGLVGAVLHFHTRLFMFETHVHTV